MRYVIKLSKFHQIWNFFCANVNETFQFRRLPIKVVGGIDFEIGKIFKFKIKLNNSICISALKLLKSKQIEKIILF